MFKGAVTPNNTLGQFNDGQKKKEKKKKNPVPPPPLFFIHGIKQISMRLSITFGKHLVCRLYKEQRCIINISFNVHMYDFNVPFHTHTQEQLSGIIISKI